MKYKIGVVTGTRADYGILKPLIEKINNNKLLSLCLIVTGMHLEEKFGNTYTEIEEDGYTISYKIPMNLHSDKEKDIVLSMSKEMSGFSQVLVTEKLDMMVVLGDRFEILVAATAATIFRVPIAHLHGGELTEGLIDDVIRHAVTKMSYLHFPSTKVYADRIIQMGENPDRVFNVGALGIENIKNLSLLSRKELSEKYNKLFLNKYIMITFHPVTLENNTSKGQFEKLLNVISKHSEYYYVFTYANADPNGQIINEIIDKYVYSNHNCIAYKSMGQIGYLSAVKYCYMVIGNSSSGIIEVPSFGVPTINIGDRQKGREHAKSVIDCGNEEDEIEHAFIEAENMKNYLNNKIINPYEGQDTSDKIVSVIIDALNKGIDIKKTFYNI